MKKLLILTLVLTVFTLVGCTAKLTKQGREVKLIMKQEAPKNYELIGDVETGFWGANNVTDVKNKLRNLTAEMGGDLVVIDVIEITTDDTGHKEYTGNGRAYKRK